VDVGQFVNRGTAMGTIYAVDFVEVRLPVQDEELAYLNIDMFHQRETFSNPAPVILRARFAGREHEWHGTVVRTEGELDPRTRMVNLVARVADPYADTHNRPPLSIGLFVDAEILGAMASDVVVIPRSALRGNDQVIIVDADERLRYRQVEVLRVDSNEVLIQSGLRKGERVCISALEIEMDGMLVRVRDDMPAVAASTPLDNPS
jgi:multidrug efflux pump subunit AcrA (membrane-fusion protein)